MAEENEGNAVCCLLSEEFELGFIDLGGGVVDGDEAEVADFERGVGGGAAVKGSQAFCAPLATQVAGVAGQSLVVPVVVAGGGLLC